MKISTIPAGQVDLHWAVSPHPATPLILLHQLISLHWALEVEIRPGKGLGDQRCDLEQSVGAKCCADEKMCVWRAI